MKRLLTILAASGTLLFSCSKRDNVSNQSLDDKSRHRITSLTVGQMHNQILSDWLDNNWNSSDDPSTEAGTLNIIHQCLTIQDQYGWLDTPIVAAEQIVVGEMARLGMFNGDGTTKDMQEMMDIVLQEQTNSS